MMLMAAPAPPVRFLDFKEASVKLVEVGIKRADGSPIKPETIRTWADRGKLPFKKGPDGKRRISEAVLIKALEDMHSDKPTKRR